jgi:ABC-type spermidine/putrescine transport system permease subunit I
MRKHTQQGDATLAEPAAVTPRASSWLQASPDFLVTALFFLAPLGVLIAYSFGRQNSLTQNVRISGTFRAYRLLFSDLYRPVLLRSTVLALVCLVICILIGVPAALALSRLPPRARRRVLIAIVFPSFISFTVRIYAWVGLLGNQGPVASISEHIVGHRIVLLYRPGSLLIGMITAYVPLFLLPVFVSLTRVRPTLIDASMDLGGKPFTTVRTILLPLAAPGILTGSALVTILALGEFLIPTVLGGGKVLLLGTLLVEQAGGRNKPLGGAIATTLLFTMILIALVSALTQRQLARRHG